MPIRVICPGCRKSFRVSDKFAGKEGPCPKCKTIIKVPKKSEEVVVHAPEDFGPKDSKGRAVLKPIARAETKVSPLLVAAIIIGILATLTVALAFRFSDSAVPPIVLVVGAIVLAPPLVWGGYAFLRDDELEPFRGREMLVRATICALVYALLWGLVAVIKMYVFEGDPLEMIHMVFIAPVMLALGAFAGYASLDLEFGTAAILYGMYLGITVLLRLIMKLPAI